MFYLLSRVYRLCVSISLLYCRKAFSLFRFRGRAFNAYRRILIRTLYAYRHQRWYLLSRLRGPYRLVSSLANRLVYRLLRVGSL